MKKYLLPQNGNFYKANLHCHSTCSDGRLTPEEIKKEYKARGYSIVAFTDHNVMYNHSYLNDDSFLALMGCEADMTQKGSTPYNQRKVIHFNYISLTPENTAPFFFGSSLGFVEKNAERFPKETEFYKKEPICRLGYVPSNISHLFEIAREKGYFVTYNHPLWSREEFPDYINYNNMSALEIFNYGSYRDGHEGYCPGVYDDMLRAGKRIYCIAADDNHNKIEDSFGGFTMIKADSLDYETVTRALVDGSFYATMGPEIYSLTFEDGIISVECSGVERIAITAGQRRGEAVWAKEGECVTSAAFRVDACDKYVRLTLTDRNGKSANTNGYFVDELFGR